MGNMDKKARLIPHSSVQSLIRFLVISIALVSTLPNAAFAQTNGAIYDLGNPSSYDAHNTGDGVDDLIVGTPVR
jgi:hypothetical protein